MTKRDLVTMYGLPREVRFCKTCTISNQRPRIVFDEHGVCSACSYAIYKKRVVDWNKREEELQILLDKHRRNDGSYDVVVPCSGGKDGGWVAHQLKYTYGMHPLTVTWAPHLATDVGRRNLDAFIGSGFDNILGTPNGKVHRLMTRLAFIHLGDPFQPFIYGQTNFPLRVALHHGIQLIVYGENGEVEYGGDMKNAFVPTRQITDHDKHYFSGLPPEFWIDHGVSKSDLHAYKAPKYEDVLKNNTEIHFFGYYKYWDPQENFYYCSEYTGFSANDERTEGTYSKYASIDDKIDGFHYYLGFIKFGIGRATADSAHEIRDEKITRDEGVGLVKRYDGEFPARYFEEFLDYVSMTRAEFDDVIDSWRSDHIWERDASQWRLRNAVWHERPT